MCILAIIAKVRENVRFIPLNAIYPKWFVWKGVIFLDIHLAACQSDNSSTVIKLINLVLIDLPNCALSDI